MTYEEHVLALAIKYDVFLPIQIVNIARDYGVAFEDVEDWIVEIKPLQPSLFKCKPITGI